MVLSTGKHGQSAGAGRALCRLVGESVSGAGGRGYGEVPGKLLTCALTLQSGLATSA